MTEGCPSVGKESHDLLFFNFVRNLGATCRNRTNNLRITSALLYH